MAAVIAHAIAPGLARRRFRGRQVEHTDIVIGTVPSGRGVSAGAGQTWHGQPGRRHGEVVVMRWLVLVPYGVLVVYVWARAGPRQGLIVLGCVLLLIACFRLVVVGRMITSWSRQLSRIDDDAGADHRPTVVRAGSYLARLVSNRRERRGLVDSPTGEDDELVVLLDGQPAPRDPPATFRT